MAVIGAFSIFLAVLSLHVQGHHECERPCRENDPRDCYYHFRLRVDSLKCVDGEGCRRHFVLSVNGFSPGPVISVCENDTVTVDVKNSLPSGLEASIHWHGLSQRSTPFMDGVPMITQCPIHSGTAFRYRMKADRPGTFYYHAHSVSLQLDGLYGALIVRRNASPGKIALIAPRLSDLTSFRSDSHDLISTPDLEMKIYGIENGGGVMRIINAAALDCPVSVGPAKVLALDGNPIEPGGADHLVLYPGERADIESVSGITVTGRNLCDGQTLVLKDETVEKTIAPPRGTVNVRLSDYYKQFSSPAPVNAEDDVYRVFLPFDKEIYFRTDDPPDFRYKLGEVTPYVPPDINSNADSVFVYQFKNKSFLYPSSPILTQFDDVDKDKICNFGSSARICASVRFCECLHVLTLPFNKTVELVVIDEGRNGKAEQTIHLHGSTFRIASAASFDEPVTVDKVKNLLDANTKDFVNPPEKDTVTVPNKGYVVLRFKTDNPGYWLLESIPSKATSGTGLEIALHVPPQHGAYDIPKNFPTCRAVKPQDLVIIDD